MNVSVSYLYQSALQCNAAYITEEAACRQAFADLGYVVLGYYSDNERQGVTVYDPLHSTYDFIISGSRVSEGTIEDHIGDLLRDIDCAPLDLGGGVKVASQPYQGARKLYAWAITTFPAGVKINVKGHSLGGWQTTYAPLYWPDDRISSMIALEPPKQGNDTFWQAYAESLKKLIQVVQGIDPWFHYPPKLITTLHHGFDPIVWIRGGEISEVTYDQLPNEGLIEDIFQHESDHGPSTLIKALAALLS